MRHHRASAHPSHAVVGITIAAVLAGCAPNRQVHARAAEEVRRGYDYLAAEDLERAEVAFAHALAFNSEIPEALNGAAVVARKKGRAREARRLLESALVAREEFAEALVNLGELDVSEGRHEAAEARFRRALSIDPDLLPARLNLARALLHRGRAESGPRREALWAAARREYLHLLETSPAVADAHHDLGFIDHEAGRFARAAASYGRAAELDVTYADAHLGACVSLARAGRFEDAAAACRRCISAAPTDPRCAANLRAIGAALPRRSSTPAPK